MRHSLEDEIQIDSKSVILRRVGTLSGIEPQYIPCCVNSCMAYTGRHMNRDTCCYCSEPRYSAPGKPRRTFCYIPLIPQLQGMYHDPTMSMLLRYRSNFMVTGPQVIKDVFDGELYQKLLKKRVVVDGQRQEHKFFSDHRDIALGICQDGFLIFQRNRKGPSATPILIQNYNLPPTIRTHAENLICVGVIPGPHQPKDTKSFILPLEEELAKLAVGVPTYDADSERMFDMHAYQLFGLGDILAIEKTLRIKGHNSMCACRSCKLKGVRNLAENGKIYYIPLKLPRGQDSDGRDPNNLPKRTHTQFIETLSTMDSLPTKTAREKKAKATGIKDWPIFRRVNSLDYAKSFPWDWMHLLLENIIPNLLDLWMGRYKGLDTGTGNYEIPLNIWNKIAEESVNATEHIPAEFTRVIPHLITQRSTWTAESYCFWFCYLFPVVLRNRFPNDKYYKHGCLLVKIMKTCLQFSITEDELNTLESDIVEWVEKYERYVKPSQPQQFRLMNHLQILLSVHGNQTLNMCAYHSWTPSFG